MSTINNDIVILMADDDEDDRFMTQKAFKINRLVNELRFVKDGQELMDYLYQRDKYSDPESAPCPDLILLDLNMPRKDGREALREIKSDPVLHSIPVVILTTSNADKDVVHSYKLGVNSYISKPVTFDGLVDVIRQIGLYWFQIVNLPKTTSDA